VILGGPSADATRQVFRAEAFARLEKDLDGFIAASASTPTALQRTLRDPSAR
jgi:hypothetical protein